MLKLLLQSNCYNVQEIIPGLDRNGPSSYNITVLNKRNISHLICRNLSLACFVGYMGIYSMFLFLSPFLTRLVLWQWALSFLKRKAESLGCVLKDAPKYLYLNLLSRASFKHMREERDD